ncbi:MAG TPA: trypsin-like peptidase domain-containing protein [Acidimicrobiales bacterium]
MPSSEAGPPDLPDEAGDDDIWRPPPAPDDRLWRHPSELDDPWAPGAHQGVSPPGPSTALVTRGRRSPGAAAVGLVAGLAGALLTWGLVAVTGGLGDRVIEVVERQATPAIGARLPAGDDAMTSVVAIAEAVRPSITRIEVEGFGGSGSGSGVLFRDNGYVLTNNHVVDGADRITVVLSDGAQHDATLVGGDEETDIAVLKIEGEGFPVAVLGTATSLQVGEPAVAIGSPLGLRGGPSVTVGVISALGRRVDGATGPPLLDMIQTDAPIAPGSSGGALLDSTGAVVGITTAIAVSEVGAEGLGFATPIDIARAVAQDLISEGKVNRVWLGIEGIDLAGADADTLGVSGGALVRSVVADSPADEAGLAVDDVIVGLDDHEIDSMSELVVVLRTLSPGDRVRLAVHRSGDEVEIDVVLSERPTEF